MTSIWKAGDRVTPRTDAGRRYEHAGEKGTVLEQSGFSVTVLWDMTACYEDNWHPGNLVSLGGNVLTDENEIEFSSDITVKLVRSMASDDMVVQAAQVSVKGENKPETVPERLINYLVGSRHGSPFEHNAFTFFVEAPIFVFREWQRHRIGSFNEMSGRYSKLNPKFYIPAPDRKLQNVGTSARPEFAPGSDYQKRLVEVGDQHVATSAWTMYQEQLKQGVANEVARMVLPVSIYSQMYWTINARSLMNFISLRIDSPDAAVRSRPQWEIQLGAEQVEAAFAECMPVTHAAFIKNGRIAP